MTDTKADPAVAAFSKHIPALLNMAGDMHGVGLRDGMTEAARIVAKYPIPTVSADVLVHLREYRDGLIRFFEEMGKGE